MFSLVTIALVMMSFQNNRNTKILVLFYLIFYHLTVVSWKPAFFFFSVEEMVDEWILGRGIGKRAVQLNAP